MTLPAVTISKNTFTTSQAPAASDGVLAILACSSAGTQDVPGGYARTDLAVNDYKYGPLTDFAAYDIAVANQPVLLQKGGATWPGTYGTITKTFASGSTTCVATAATAPYDHYSFLCTFLTSGTIGVAGLTYTTSQDAGENPSGTTALGTATSLVVPNTGMSFDLAGQIAVGDTFSCFTGRPKMGDTDITASLAVLGVCRTPYEGILIDCSATVSTVGLIDTILSAWEKQGIFKFAIINSRFKKDPMPTAESEAAYAADLATTFGSQTSIRVCVGADGANVPSSITGWDLKRPTSLLLAARAMAIPLGEDPAYVARGAIVGARLGDLKGNPFNHDEDLYPNVDALRLVAMRSFAPGGPQGAYINNANSIQPSGGAYPYLQHIRIMNRACTIAWAVLTTQLSRGVRKNDKPDPVTKAVTIFEPDASAIETLVNEALIQPLKGQVSAAAFSLSRTDDLSVVPAKVTGLLSIVALAYIKGYQIQAQYSRTLQSAL